MSTIHQVKFKDENILCPVANQYINIDELEEDSDNILTDPRSNIRYEIVNLPHAKFYNHTKEQHAFAEREINGITLCNEFAELYQKDNEDWIDSLTNANDVCGHCDKVEQSDDCAEHENNYHEIFQWYIVCDYLAKKLESIGESILTTSNHMLWGRTCRGQAIILDGTFQKVHKAIGGAS